MVELLSPVGDFECLKAAVQNGANAVYFGAKSFGARAFASNFEDETLEQAINYAKIRNVKTHLTLNTLIKEDEFQDAINLAKKAYEYGIDSIIVQDIGLATKLIELFPDLDIHASTQMTVHNLEGVQLLQKLGFKRAVLSRELSFEEIEYICKNTVMEIEVFVHGALCVSYSGQCLFSSMIGCRSGNRGKCAGTCRLPYELLEEISPNTTKKIDNGYLLSTRDICGLEYLPKLIKAGVTSFKIEGRMKSPEYVATVTRIYRKYIDLAINKSSSYKIDDADRHDLMQVYNRGGFSNGHLDSSENKGLVFKEKQNNMGIYLGKVKKYNANKGHITCKLEESVNLGDSISFEKENTKYTISELMKDNSNIKQANIDESVTLGRMKGNIHTGDKIYKISSKSLSEIAINSYSKENIKTKLSCQITIKEKRPIFISISSLDFNVNADFEYNYISQSSQNQPLTKEKIINQFNKTLDTPFEFVDFTIDLDNNLFLPISIINDIRRTSIKNIEEKIIKSFKRIYINIPCLTNEDTFNSSKSIGISLLLNILNLEFDYNSLHDVDKLYIPLKYFGNNKYFDLLKQLSNKFNLYIYMPNIVRKNYIPISKKIIENSLNSFNLKGIVISNISQLQLVDNSINLDIIGNYTLNVYNSFSSALLNSLKINTLTISPELNEKAIIDVCLKTTSSKELIVYGNIPLMTMNYCLLGNTNKCYKDCKKKCLSKSKFYLKDRMNIKFRVIPDNCQTLNTIYNSKTTSIEYSQFNLDFARIDILDETIDEINNIIGIVKSGQRLEGINYTNGNLFRDM